MNPGEQDAAQGSSGPTESKVEERPNTSDDNQHHSEASTAHPGNTNVNETAGASSKEANEAAQNDSVSFKLPSMNIKPVKKKENKNESDFKEPSLNIPKPKTALSVEKQESASPNAIPKKEQTRDLKPASNEKSKNISPAELLKQNQVSIPYKEPSWGGLPNAPYSFEVLKNGKIIDNVDLSKRSCHVVGRLPACDITMEHPSLSRFHAVVQFCAVKNDRLDVGWYLYDLDSTHGTTVNKVKIKPRVYYRIKVGHLIKFGLSTRMNILQGPDEDAEEESEFTLTELKEKREMQIKEMEARKEMEQAEKEDEENGSKEEEDTGCAWGMGEDAKEQEGGGDASFLMDALPQNEELYIDDPKKALRGFFEREGLDVPEYDMEEVGNGKHTCRVEVPIDTPTGQPVVAEVTTTGKKKDAVVACALEACRILDKMGELRKANHESRKKKAKNWEEADFYDSDDDTFLDRTGTIEKKREFRMKKAGKIKQKTETYDSLMEQLKDVDAKVADIETQLEKCKAEAAKLETEESGIDALDAFMASIKSGKMDTKTKIKLKKDLFELKKEQARLQKLADIARPANVPALKKPEPSSVPSKSFLLFGKLRGPSKPPKQAESKDPTPAELAKMSSKDTEEEEEEDEDEVIEEEKIEKPSKNKDSIENTSVKSGKENVKNVTDSVNVDVEKTIKETVTDSKDSDSKIEKYKDMDVGRSSSEKSSELSRQSPRGTPLTKEEQVEDQGTEFVTKAKKRSKQAETNKSKKPKTEFLSKEYNASDPDYDVWVPPKGQSGDGKTHLNAKFGY